jgi:two-component system phosphate regulon sensor histidine kinase PhoR
MRTRFRTRIFLASFLTAALALTTVTVVLVADLRRDERASIARRLTEQGILVSELLSPRADLTTVERIDDEADRLGDLVQSRVTLIAPDGQVLGDSAVERAAIASLENHLQRPEIVLARGTQAGTTARYSTTVERDMLYAAVAVTHPAIGFVRLALPVTDVAEQVRRVGAGALLALGVSATLAVALAWITSVLVSRRIEGIAAAAQRYRTAESAMPRHDYGTDELGAVARVLDASVQQLAGQLQELSRDRARTDALLTGMVEGVLVVDRQGRLQLINRAAQEMLRVAPSSIGRPFVEVIRHPDVASRLATALAGTAVEATELELTRDPGRIFVARAAPPISGARTRSGATSWPTCRTSSARR